MLKGLFRTKNLDDILAGIGGPQFALKRTLGAFNVTLIGIGAIIGAGIFATVGSAAAGDAAAGRLAGVILILVGLVLGAAGSVMVATTSQPTGRAE